MPVKKPRVPGPFAPISRTKKHAESIRILEEYLVELRKPQADPKIKGVRIERPTAIKEANRSFIKGVEAARNILKSKE